MLDFILSEIQDPLVRENFLRLSSFLKDQTILEGNWEFYEVEFKAAVTNFKFKHNLSFVPVDIIPLAIVGDHNVYFRSENFTRKHIDITVAGPCRIRFLAGRYKEGKLDSEPVFLPITGSGSGITQLITSMPTKVLITNPTGPTTTININESALNTNASKFQVVKVASEDIIAGEVVYAVSNTNVGLASYNLTQAKAYAFGIALNSALTGANVTVILFGAITDASFSIFTVNSPLFLDVLGGITDVRPTTNYLTIIGKALGSSEIFINIENPVRLT